MNQTNTPLFDALLQHTQKKPFSLHVPGHKSGEVFLEKGLPFFQKILTLDMTELTGLDDLHEPTEAIAEAELLLSELYGSTKSFFLVNGSTVGNLAMVLSTCHENDMVIVSRNCHKSIMNGLKLAGARPVFVSPEIDEVLHVPTYVSEKRMKEAIDQHPEAKVVIVTNPNYYGQTFDLTPIITYAHKKGIPVLVDEAHGAHFGIGASFPDSALKSGADIVVQSAHKTLPAMTMGSYLHFQSDLISIDKVKFYLQALQSSSPSYPIMASLDLARAYLANIKEKGTTIVMDSINQVKDQLRSIRQIEVVLSKDTNIKQDPLKLVLQSRTTSTGYELQALLEKEGIYTELADPSNVLCILPLETKHLSSMSEKIRYALRHLEVLPFKREAMEFEHVPSYFPYSYRELRSKKIKAVPVEEAIGQLSAETVIPYPPGIPLLLEGEKITITHLNQMRTLQEMGVRFQGTRLTTTLNIYECE